MATRTPRPSHAQHYDLERLHELEAVARPHFAQEEEIYLLLQGDGV